MVYDLEEEEIVTNVKEGDHCMPSCFRDLIIKGCHKLNEVPSNLFSPTLKMLKIERCGRLSGLQCLPPFLERLELRHGTGGYSKSFPIDNECSISRVSLDLYPHSSLPGGFEKLEALQTLEFRKCRNLDFELKELEHFTMLQVLDIYKCPVLKEQFQRDDWRSILAHVPRSLFTPGV